MKTKVKDVVQMVVDRGQEDMKYPIACGILEARLSVLLTDIDTLVRQVNRNPDQAFDIVQRWASLLDKNIQDW